jgi:hypothetical protein
MECNPAVKAAGVHVAVPLLITTALQRVVAPSLNVTVPVGKEPLPDAGTVAVNVAADGYVAGLADDDTLTVGVALATVTFTEPVTGLKLLFVGV